MRLSEVLEGWVQIANHMDRSEVWCRRMAKLQNRPLPVFKVGGTVRAHRADLDGWIRDKESEPYQPRQRKPPIRIHELADRVFPCSDPVTGYVYLAQPVEGGLIKIGWTERPRERLAGLNHFWQEVKFLALIPTVDPITLERRLHKLYDDKRVRGEWFSLTTEDIDRLEEACSLSTREAK